MNRMKKLLAFLLALAMVFSMAACGNDDGSAESTGTGEVVTGENGTYTVGVKTVGGMALSGIDVYIYADSTLSDLKQYGETDANGQVSFSLPTGGSYAIVLSGVPKGYQVEDHYTFNGNSAVITLTSALITDESLSGATLGLGDVMYDFSVVTPAGETVKLSDVLAEKKMVLLNFWYTTCTWCITEFPIMEQAYQQYKDDIEIIAVDPFDQNPAIESFQAQHGLSFPMANCPTAWSTAFGVSGYPTSVIIDRYGVICVVESGAITSLRPFVSAFEHFTAEDYQQKICTGGIGDLVTDVVPTYTMATSEEIAAVLNSGDIQVTYRPETGDGAELCWPFIIGEKNGDACVYASNQGIEDSYAILYADVYLQEGQAVGFDYLTSTELGADMLYVIVDGEDINQIHGVSENESWNTCYSWVAEKEGTYEVAMCYLKDSSDNVGDDTVYIKNLRVVNASEIEVPTFIPRQAAASEDGFEYTYAEIVLNEEDSYYHVGDANGPLLLVNMMGYTQFSEEQTLWDIVYNGNADLDGRNMYEEMLSYFSYASNSNLNGYCTVTEELANLLADVDKAVGFDDEDTQEWLKLCCYYQSYGRGSEQLEDPIKGLAPFAAYEAKLGKNVESNYFYYNRAIIPRGLLAEFIPNRSGVYRITSRAESEAGVDGWIFSENREELLVYEMDERMWSDQDNVSMVFYMEAGQKYYIDIAFWDMYETGYIPYDIEYVAPTLQHFRLAAPGYFTYDSDATGDAMYYLIAGGIDVVLGEDGYYYEDLGDGKKGSKLYADFAGITTLFDTPISTVENSDGTKILGMIDKGGFDFSKTEYDLYVLGIMKNHNDDVEATDAYLRELWGADYEAYAEIYMLEDVYKGVYHGKGEDLTEEMRGYANKIIRSGSIEAQGCVVVDARLAEILQMLMDKYTFANVDHSWTKLCYYYDYLGPEQ